MEAVRRNCGASAASRMHRLALRRAERLAEPVLDEPHNWLSRRSFLRYSALSGGLLALSRVRVVPAAAAATESAAGLQVLSANEAEVFTVVVERMVASNDPAMPKVRDTKTILAIDQALVQLDPSMQTQVHWLLRLIQWGPPLLMFRMSTFTGLSTNEQDEYLRGWASSPRELRRLAFRALKNLSMLGYYSQDAVWPALHYRGPWQPRPRRYVNGATGTFQANVPGVES